MKKKEKTILVGVIQYHLLTLTVARSAEANERGMIKMREKFPAKVRGLTACLLEKSDTLGHF